jgi:exonuclease III
MILLSLNIQGLRSPSKRILLVKLIEIQKPDVLIIEETMDKDHKLVMELGKLLKHWDFMSLDVVGNCRDV